MVCPCLSSRWVISRLKRCAMLSTLLMVILMMAVLIMTLLNQVQLSIHLTGVGDSLRQLHSGIVRTARPMVQFFPDNQQKLAFRRPVPTEAKGQRGLAKDDVSYNVHVFYYGWYANPKFDTDWFHWNHPFLPNWDKSDPKKYPSGRHDPTKDDIGSDFYPALGPYSSADPEVIRLHMKQIRSTGAGVVVVSWYPQGKADENGFPSDRLIPTLLDEANEQGLKIALHIEPYENRTIQSLNKDLQYVNEKYAPHPAFYRHKMPGRYKSLPVYYVYDSYHTSSVDWSLMLKHGGSSKHNVRGTALDGIFLGLVVDYKHRNEVKNGCFDGFYTYFAANGFSHGSSWKNWRSLSSFAQRSGLIFSPSVGPGYTDVSIRPWNAKTTRSRLNGQYYEASWKAATSFSSKFVSITSFNEWGEGTQIEPAIPMSNSNFTYLDYLPNQPNYYLGLTRKWVTVFEQNKRNSTRNLP